jgi:hypothetical protein
MGPTHPPIKGVPGAKRAGREAGHSPSSSAEIRNGGAISPLPYTSSRLSTLSLEHKDNFNLMFNIIIIEKHLLFKTRWDCVQ